MGNKVNHKKDYHSKRIKNFNKKDRFLPGFLNVLPSVVIEVRKRYGKPQKFSKNSKPKLIKNKERSRKPPVVWFPNQNPQCEYVSI